MNWDKRILPSLLFLLLHLKPLSASAAVFFRYPEANFSSGQATQDELEKNLIRIEFKPHYEISWDQKKYQVKGDQIIFDKQLAQHLITKKNALLRSEAKTNASFIKNLSENTVLNVLRTDAYWAEVYVPKVQLKGWIPLSQTDIANEEIGVFLPLVDTFLRAKPEQNGQILTTIPSLNRIIPIEFKKNWILVNYLGQKGYVDLHHLIHRSDFAKWAYSKKRKSWLPISRREDGSLITLEQKKYPLSDFIAFNGNDDKAILIESLSEYGPYKFSHVEVTRKDSDLWAMSYLNGHGEVWWKKQILINTESDKNEITITNEQLLKRKIFSIALTNEKQLHGLVSAEGVFKTNDGKKWTQLKQFGNQDVPVAIQTNGIWIVGDYKSTNAGKTFEPYIRWDWVAQSIENNLYRTPKYLRLQKVTLKNDKIEITVDTGYRKVLLQSSVHANSLWKIIL